MLKAEAIEWAEVRRVPSASRPVILEDVLAEGRVCLKALQKSLAPDLLLSVITLVYRGVPDCKPVKHGPKRFFWDFFSSNGQI